MQLQLFHHQHRAISDAVDDLCSMIEQDVERHAARIATRLETLSTSIVQHLAHEDATLYPALRRASQRETARLGQQFQDEMLDISRLVRQFLARWPDAARIALRPESFRQDAQSTWRILRLRIEREERELYPLAASL